MALFKVLLNKVEQFNSARITLSADMAEAVQNVKALAVKAEDARIRFDLQEMKKTFAGLQQYNEGLVAEYKKRSLNHQELLNCLK